jgi:hypothetical protein
MERRDGVVVLEAVEQQDTAEEGGLSLGST